MENILKILEGLGIEVPDDKQAELNKKVAENYKTKAEFDNKVEKMQGDLDAAKERAKTAEDTLKGFEGKDFDTITRDRDEWKTKYETMVREEQEAREKKELDEAIENAIKEAKGKNAKAILANLDMEAIKASKNRDKDIASQLKTLAESEETAFLFSTDPENNRARFTGQLDNTGKATQPKTKEEIAKITNKSERQAAIRDYIAANGSY